MKLTNNYNLPEYLVNSISNYTPNPDLYRIGATDLISPPLIRTLKRKHHDEIESDISEYLNMIAGNAVDEYFKRHSRYGLCNLKFETKFGDWTVVSKPDYYNPLDLLLADFKRTSIWNYVHKSSIDEWTAQLNIYNYALFNNKSTGGEAVEKLEVHALWKDWRRGEKLQYGSEYPDREFSIIPIKLWSMKETEQYIDIQIKDHELNSMRECTPEECWMKQTTFAVVKTGQKRAKRVLDTEADAKAWMSKNGGDRIDIRVGSCVRCESYCVCNRFCPYFNKKENETNK